MEESDNFGLYQLDQHPIDVSTNYSIRGEHELSEFVLNSLDKEKDIRVRFNLGFHYCRKGKWKEAIEHLDAGRWLNCYGNEPLKSGIPIWNEQDIKGKRVHVRCEGGYGDEIINIRFVKNLVELGAIVIVSCSPGLLPTFSRIPGVTVALDGNAANAVYTDYWIPAMSFPRWFEPTGEPYLTADPRFMQKWSRIIKSKDFKVGIRWAGNPKFEHQQYRKFPPELMLNLSKIENTTFYSLQRDEDTLDLSSYQNIIDIGESLTIWEDTAAAIMNMDLVITSCTAVAHLAGALGKPFWVVVPCLCYYPWAVPGDTTVWYNTAKIYRQEVFGEWHQPFEKIAKDLDGIVNGRKN